MNLDDLCRRYLYALNEGDLHAMLALFAPDALIESPLYGEMEAPKFYADVFADTYRSNTKLLHIFTCGDIQTSLALHFRYEWTLHTGYLADFQCVDVFELTEDRQHFQRLTIIYDTAHLRKEFAARND